METLIDLPGAKTRVDKVLSDLSAYLADGCDRISMPAQAFVSPELFELEQERIFSRAWMMVGRADELATAGDYLALTIAGEPIVVVRGDDGELRALSTLCRHRLMPVVAEGSGNLDRFTCPYHLWKYGLDGHLIGATYMQGVEGFDPISCQLPTLPVEEWLGFVFVNLDPGAEPLAPRLAAVEAEVATYGLGDDWVQVAYYDREWYANWKIIVENGAESYHHMGLHAESVDPFLPARGTYAKPGGDWFSYHRTPMGGRYPSPTHPGLTEDDLTEAKLFTLFPTSALLTAGEFVLWANFIPVSVDCTRVIAGTMFPRSSIPTEGYDAYAQGHLEGLEAINAEDKSGSERIHRVAGSRYADRGHLSPKEPAVMDFYRFLARSLCT